MGILRTGIAAVATLAIAGTATAANDSTSVEEVDVPWQKPWARTSDTATYADNAGQLGGKVESQLNVATAGLASYVPSTGVTGLPTCVAGYVLQKTATGFLCVNTISNANAANSANYSSTAGNGVAGVSGSTLNLTNGTQHTLPSGGGGGDGGGVTGACTAGTIHEMDSSYTGWATCWGTAKPRMFAPWDGYCTSGTIVGCPYTPSGGYCYGGNGGSFSCK